MRKNHIKKTVSIVALTLIMCVPTYGEFNGDQNEGALKDFEVISEEVIENTDLIYIREPISNVPQIEEIPLFVDNKNIFSSFEGLKSALNKDVQFYKSTSAPYYLVAPNSTNFDQVIASGNNLYRFRVYSVEMNQANAGPIVLKSHLATVVPGYEATLSKTVTNKETRTIQVGTTAEISAGLKLKGVADFGVKVSKSYSNTNSNEVVHTVNSGEKFTFSPHYITLGYKSVDFFSAFTHDEYKAILEYIPLKAVGLDEISRIQRKTKTIRFGFLNLGRKKKVEYHLTLKNGKRFVLSQGDYNKRVKDFHGRKYYGHGRLIEGELVREEVMIKEPRGTLISIPNK